MLCAKFGWNWSSASWEEDFENLLMYFSYIVIISPWKRAGHPIELTWIPITQGYVVPSLVKIGQVVLEKILTFFKSIFRYFVIISHWKRVWPFIWINLNTLCPRMLCAKFGWNWPSGSFEEDENVKSLQTDRRTTGDQKSLLELSAQVS